MKKDSVKFNHEKIANINIVYEIHKSINISDYPTLENCLLGAFILTKNADINNYKYSRYAIGFHRKGSYSIGNEIGRNIIIFGVDMSLTPHNDNKEKDILFLGRGPT